MCKSLETLSPLSKEIDFPIHKGFLLSRALETLSPLSEETDIPPTRKAFCYKSTSTKFNAKTQFFNK